MLFPALDPVSLLHRNEDSDLRFVSSDLNTRAGGSLIKKVHTLPRKQLLFTNTHEIYGLFAGG
jgi:hypothetical protein